jgi:plastocyanin
MSRSVQRILNRFVIVLGISLIAATAAVFVIHDGPSAEAGAQNAGGVAAPDGTVQIKDFLYDPEAVTISLGTTITFTNEDSAPHTATSGSSPNADSVFETGTLKKGESKAVTVTKAGTVAYYCAIHPFMKGTVVVK